MSSRVHLHLRLPFAPTEEGVDAWLKGQLPLANSRERCRQLYAALQALNSSAMDPLTHSRILEHLQPTVDAASRTLLAGFLGQPLPFAERTRNTAKLSAQFQAELARGLQSALMGERVADDLSAADRVRLALLALRAYEQYLLRLALMYESVPSSLWSKVNALYGLARQWACRAADSTAVRAVFARILAFHLVCPNRLGQADTQKLFELVQQHAALIDLLDVQPPGEMDAGSADFLVDLDAAAQPRFLSTPQSLGEGQCFLRTERFRRRLLLQTQSTVSATERLGKDFAVRIVVRLGGSLPFVAEEKPRRAVLVLGVDAIVAVAARADTLSADGKPWLGPAGLGLVPLSDHAGVQAQATASKSAGTFSVASSAQKAAMAGAYAEIWGRPQGEYPCQIFRSEVPGFYFLDPGAASVHPGDLIGVNTDNKLIQVGLLGAARGGGLFPFELLANQVRVVRLSGASVAVPYLGLAAQSVDGARCTLLGNPIALRSGDAVELEHGGRRRCYRIAKLLESSATFTQYELVAAEHGEAALA